MREIRYKFLIVTCTKCNESLWSNDHEEILQMKELLDKKALRCPYCHSLMRLEILLANGRGGRASAIASSSPPSIFEDVLPPPASSPPSIEEGIR